jgi:hypothetical protein
MECRYRVEPDAVEAFREAVWRYIENKFLQETSRSQDNIEDLMAAQVRQADNGAKVEMAFGSEAGEPTEDDMMEVFELAQKGELTAPYRQADLSEEQTNDQIMQSLAELEDGTTNGRRALENARQGERESEEWWLEYYRVSGSPLNVDHERLRPRLREHRY